MKRRISFVLTIVIFLVSCVSMFGILTKAEETMQISATVVLTGNSGELTNSQREDSTPFPNESAVEYPTADPTDSPTDEPIVGPTDEPTDPEPTDIPNDDSSADKLKKVKKAAIEKLTKYLDPDNYADEEIEFIDELIETIKEDVANLKTIDEVNKYVRLAKKILDDVPTKVFKQLKIKFKRERVRATVGQKISLAVKVTPKNLGKKAKKVRWVIGKKSKKIISFAGRKKEINGKMQVQIMTKQKGKAKVVCIAPNGKKSICTIVVK